MNGRSRSSVRSSPERGHLSRSKRSPATWRAFRLLTWKVMRASAEHAASTQARCAMRTRLLPFPPTRSSSPASRPSRRTTRARPSVRAARRSERWALMAGLPGKAEVLVLGASPREAPDSSLSRMTALFAEKLGWTNAEDAHFVRDGVLDLASLDERVARATVKGESVLF